jgi:hypothetical protein
MSFAHLPGTDDHLEIEDPPAAADQLNSTIAMTRRRLQLAIELEELVAALDRRVPRVEQAGESSIARDAAALRARAMARLAELATVADAVPETD